VCVCFKDEVSLCSPGGPWTYDLPASASQMLVLQACATHLAVLNFKTFVDIFPLTIFGGPWMEKTCFLIELLGAWWTFILINKHQTCAKYREKEKLGHVCWYQTGRYSFCDILIKTSKAFITHINFFFLFGGPGVWTQGLTLARQVLYHFSHSTTLVHIGIGPVFTEFL
jgi:hypothetical protein